MARPVVIYVLLDADGRRRYVGKSVNAQRRFVTHQRGKFSWAVAYDVLETCDEVGWEARERYWIAYGRENGWPLENVAAGGNGVPSWYQHTDAMRAKLSEINHRPDVHKKIVEAARRQMADPDQRERRAEAQRQRYSDPEEREKTAAIQRRRWSDPKVRERQAEVTRRQMADPKARERQAEAMRGRVMTEEHRANLAKAQRRRWLDPKERIKMSEAQQRRWLDPKVRERQVETHRGKKHSNETRAKMREAQRQCWAARKRVA